MVGSSQRTRRIPSTLGRRLMVLLLVAVPAPAQQLSNASVFAEPSTEGRADSPKTEPEPKPQPGATSERLFYALPNYLTVESSGNARSLTPAKKFELVTRNTYDYVEFPWYAAQASIRQAHDSQPEYGQGAAGYGKRYALTFADCTVEGFLVGAVFPSVLRQDPRYFRMGRGPSNPRRISYAMSRIFVTRGDSGRSEFNYSEVVGSAVGAGLSNYGYHPPSDHNLQNVAIGWGTQMAFHTFSLLMKEFWPDFRMKMSGAAR